MVVNSFRMGFTQAAHRLTMGFFFAGRAALWMRVLFVAVLLAGCTAVDSSLPIDGGREPGIFHGNATVRASACPPGQPCISFEEDASGDFFVLGPRNATVDVNFSAEWTPTTPTTARLRFLLVGGGDVAWEGDGASPLEASIPLSAGRSYAVEVSLSEESGVGIEQRVSFSVTGPILAGK